MGSVSIDITGCTSATTESPVYFHPLYPCLGINPCSVTYYLTIYEFVESIMKILTVDQWLFSKLKGQ